MLTLEQLALGRSYATHDEESFDSWLREHAEALLDAAERVARQEAYANEPDGYDSPNPAEPTGFTLERRGDGSSVARYFNAKGEPVRNPADPSPQAFELRDELVEGSAAEALWKASEARLAAVRQRAAERFAELQPAAAAEFVGRPWAPDGTESADRVLTFGEVESWFEARGLRVRIYPNYQNGNFAIDPVACVEDDIGRRPIEAVDLRVHIKP